jgi:hypothetical protein
LAVTLVAAALVVTAELVVISGSVAHRPTAHHRRRSRQHAAPPPYGGEPQLPSGSRVAPGAWVTAVRFVRDYAQWSDGQLAAVPAEDATPRVIRLIDRQVRGVGARHGELTGSVRMTAAGTRTYVVTSPVGNFLVGRAGARWLVVSLPGD